MVGPGQEQPVSDVIERFVKALVITAKAVVLYPPSSEIPVQTAQNAQALLAQALRREPVVTLAVTKGGLYCEGQALFPGSTPYQSFAEELYLRRLADVRFHAGTTARDLVAFLSVLRYTPEELEAVGGAEGRLWGQGVVAITVTQPQVVIVTGDDAVVAGAAVTRDAIVEALSSAAAGTEGSSANEALVEAARELGPDGLVEMLLEDFDESSVSRDGLTRALRTIALVTAAGRESVLRNAVGALRRAGASDEFIDDVSEGLVPSRIAVDAEEAAPAGTSPADAVMQLIGLAAAPSSMAAASGDPEIMALASEAQRGITDGDVVMALVSLLVLGDDDAASEAVARVLDDALDVLVELGAIDVAADVASALAVARADSSLPMELRRRLEAAAAKLSRTSDLRRVVQILRLHAEGTPEHDAARRFVDALGPVAIKPLLEELAEEEDMATRKALVGILSGMAPGNAQAFGSHVTDARWYVVRNVVSILGAVHSAESLPYLTRTLRHPDARVRRETIRGLSGIQDRRANEMLASALSDEDAQNVQLAARYLGRAGVKEALPDLEQVARGDGKGNRDTGPRVEAIESIGRIGDPSSLPALDAITSKRSLLRASKSSEVRTAAQSAAERIRRGGR